MEFNRKVYLARMQLGLTQAEFAKKLSCGYATINRWENGTTQPTKLKQYTFEQFCKNNNICFVEDSK